MGLQKPQAILKGDLKETLGLWKGDPHAMINMDLYRITQEGEEVHIDFRFPLWILKQLVAGKRVAFDATGGYVLLQEPLDEEYRLRLAEVIRLAQEHGMTDWEDVTSRN